MNVQERGRGTFIRFSFYFFGIAVCVFLVLRLLIQFGFQILLKDNNIIEWTEFFWLFVSSIFLFLSARSTGAFRTLYGILWIFPVVAGIRELDVVFDQIFHGAWAVPAGFLYALILYRGYVNFPGLKKETLRFVHTQQIVFLGLGLFVVVFIAQFMGQKVLWHAMLGQSYQRIIGRFVEEFLEFFGYILILVGSVECYLDARADSK